MLDHRVVVRTLPASRLTDAFWLRVGAEVHVREIYPDEKWRVGSRLPLNEVYGPIGDVIINPHHPLSGERSGVPHDLLSDASESWIDGPIVVGRSLAVQHAARS